MQSLVFSPFAQSLVLTPNVLPVCAVWGSLPTCFVENAYMYWANVILVHTFSVGFRVYKNSPKTVVVQTAASRSVELTTSNLPDIGMLCCTLTHMHAHTLTHMHACTHSHAHLHTHLYTHTLTHIYTHNACVQPHTYMHASTNACTVMYACTRTTVTQKPHCCLVSSKHTHKHTHTHTHTHTYTHTRAHTHTHTHTHTHNKPHTCVVQQPCTNTQTNISTCLQVVNSMLFKFENHTNCWQQQGG